MCINRVGEVSSRLAHRASVSLLTYFIWTPVCIKKSGQGSLLPLPAWLKNAGFYLHSHLNVMHSVCSHWQALEPPT